MIPLLAASATICGKLRFVVFSLKFRPSLTKSDDVAEHLVADGVVAYAVEERTEHKLRANDLHIDRSSVS